MANKQPWPLGLMEHIASHRHVVCAGHILMPGTSMRAQIHANGHAYGLVEFHVIPDHLSASRRYNPITPYQPIQGNHHAHTRTLLRTGKKASDRFRSTTGGKKQRLGRTRSNPFSIKKSSNPFSQKAQ